MTPSTDYDKLDHRIDTHFDEEVRFLQELIRVPTDTPPGHNAPHAERMAELLKDFGFEAEKHAVTQAEVEARGLQSITNLIVRRNYAKDGAGLTIALNAHGDVVPPGDGWTTDPYGGEIRNGSIYGRASAVSKSDFASLPGVIYGAGPRSVLESHAKRADERLALVDLRGATKVIARTLLDLLSVPKASAS